MPSTSKKFGSGSSGRVDLQKANVKKTDHGQSQLFKEGGIMKSVDTKKNPGVAKLPTAVRNKMGFMKKGGMAEDDKSQDKSMIKKAVKQHDDQLHGGKKTKLALKKGGMACAPKKYEEGGEVEFESKMGSNKNIDSDSRIKAMDMLRAQNEDYEIETKDAPKAKAASKPAKPASKFSTSDTEGGAAVTFRKQSSPKSTPAKSTKPAAKKSSYTADHSMGVAMKRGGSVRGCGIAKKGLTKGKIV